MRLLLRITALLLFLLPGLLLAQTTKPVLPDVAVSHENYAAIQYLYHNGVINGYDDGTFQPSRTISRGELAKILVGGRGVDPQEADYNNCFTDVTAGDWYVRYVCYAKEQGWVKGYPAGDFQPAKTVQTEEAIKMIVASQGYVVPESVDSLPYADVDAAQWYGVYTKVASDKGLLVEANGNIGVGAGMTRAGVAESIYRAMVIADLDIATFVDYKIDGPYKVTNVVDGDTVDVLANGEELRLRLIGVDTPETKDPRKPVECFGKEASAYTEAKLLDQYVFLQKDDTQEDIDKYDRALRYVIMLDGQNFNEMVIADGYAFEYTYEVPYMYTEGFQKAELDADIQNLGLWAEIACNGEQKPADGELDADTEEADEETEDELSINYKFYASSQAKTKYYCETDSAWEGLSKDNLMEFLTELELLEWAEARGFELVLNQPC